MNNSTAHPVPLTALATAWQRGKQRAWRTVVFVGLLCLGIASLLTVIDGGRFHIKLLYSSCIGACCALITDAVRLLQAAALDRLRHWRGQPPAPGVFASGWGGLPLAVVVASLAGPATGVAVVDWLTGFKSPSLLSLDAPATRITLVLSLLATVITVFVLSTLERLASARAQAEAAQRQATEQQLRLLQSQLEPHMLFNTLANLRVLIGLDPQRAQDMLDRLIAFLRATLQASRRLEHPLADEFERVGDYLALMGVRMGPRLQVRLDLPAALREVPVPPLLLQPLVENSIRHGLEPQVAGGLVEVSAAREGDTLCLSVRDTGIGQRAAASAALGADPGQMPSGGFGLTGARERLATLFGSAASLELLDAPDAGGGTLVRVRLPIRAPNPSVLPALATASPCQVPSAPAATTTPAAPTAPPRHAA